MEKTDAQWIGEIVSAYEKPLVAYARDLLGNLENARDAVQESFIALCREPRSQVETKVKSWLFTVCRNRCFDRLRKDHRMQPIEPEQMDLHPSHEPSPSEVMDKQETSTQLLHHLKALPPNQREVIRLKFLNGMSYRDISSVTQLSESNVGFLIHTGLGTLRRRMNPQPLS